MYEQYIHDVGKTVFGEELFHSASSKPKYMVNFLRDDVYDENDVLIEEAPKVYEDGGSLDSIRDRVYMFMEKYNQEFPSKKLGLVLFEDALKHMLRISRLLEMPRASGLWMIFGFFTETQVINVSPQLFCSQKAKLKMTSF